MRDGIRFILYVSDDDYIIHLSPIVIWVLMKEVTIEPIARTGVFLDGTFHVFYVCTHAR